MGGPEGPMGPMGPGDMPVMNGKDSCQDLSFMFLLFFFLHISTLGHRRLMWPGRLLVVNYVRVKFCLISFEFFSFLFLTCYPKI